MPKRTSLSSEPRRIAELTIPASETRSKIEVRKSMGGELRQRQVGSLAEFAKLEADHQTWTSYNLDLLRRLFSTDELALEYKRCRPNPEMYFGPPPFTEQARRTFEILDAEVHCLSSIVDRLDLFPAPEAHGADSPPSGRGARTPIETLEHLANRFHVVARRLHVRHGGRETLKVNDEYDVQDLLHALLLTEFEDVRPEEHTPSYAGGSSRMDFLLKDEQVVVEVKCARDGLGGKEVGEQLSVDIVRYQSHPNCKSLFCFVYDPSGRINNPRGLENDLSHDRHGLPTIVRVRPKYS